MNTGLEPCHALWIGERLGPVAGACLRSFVRVGHPVVLHCYDEPRDAPDGVVLSDAATLVPRDRVFTHAKTGSYALFSNYFRYQIMQRSLGLYVDCDVVCVRPVPTRSYLFGLQDVETINGAVLKLPSGSPLLGDLTALFDQGVFAPPWYSRQRRLTQYIKTLFGRHADLAHAPWGVAGPVALTWFAKKHGLRDWAQPMDVFYPVPHTEVSSFFDPDVTWESLITEQTCCVHLWNEKLRRENLHLQAIRPGSPLQRLLNDEWPVTPVM